MITKQQLGNTLWGMAEILYDKVEDYKTYILSLLFFKRLSDNWTWEIDNKVREHVATYGKQPNARQLAAIAAEAHDFVIPEGCFWGDVKNASSSKKNQKLDAAVKALAEVNPPLKGIINAVQWNAPAPDGSGGKRLIRDGKFERPVLGAQYAEVQRLPELGLNKGVAVLDVTPGGPAAIAGLKPFTRDVFGNIVIGDVIVAIDDRPVENTDELFEALEAHQPGDMVVLTVLRGKKQLRQHLTVKLASPD